MKFTGLLIITLTFTADAADLDNGGALHAAFCAGRHDAAIYSREYRKVNSLPELGTQVRFCKDNLGLTWFDDEVDDVIGFLNREYYHF